MSPIKYHSRGPSRDRHQGLASLVCLGLGYLTLFRSFRGHNLLGLWVLPPFHYILLPLVPFSFVVGRLNWGRRRKFSLGWLLGCFAPNRGLHYIQQASLLLPFDSHVCWNGSLFFVMICLYRERTAEVTNRSFWRQRLVKDVKVVLGIGYFNYFFSFFLFFFFLFLDDWM